MLFPKLFFSLIQRDAFSSVELLDAGPNGDERFSALQAMEHCLVAFSVLDHQLSAAIHGEHERSLLVLKSPHVLFDVALKLGNGANLS